MSPRIVIVTAAVLFVATIGACCATGGGVYEVDGAKFRRTKPVPGAPKVTEPSVYIDTNASFSGAPIGWARVSTHRPYSIRLGYTDSTASFSSLEITSLSIRYADGTVEKAALSALSLPLRKKFSSQTSTNSSSGRIVKTTSSVVHAQLPGVITKDQDIEIEIEGHFVEKSGSLVPFKIVRSYEYEREKESQPMYELWKNV